MSWKRTLLHEAKRLGLGVLYFTVGLELLVVMLHFLSPELANPGAYYAGAFFAALLVAKILHLAEALALERWIRGFSFLGGVAARSAAYALVALAALLAEGALHGVLAEGEGWSEALRSAAQTMSGRLFVAKSLYLFVLFGLYGLLIDLRQYLAGHSLSDVLLSRYRAPRREPFVVMRLAVREPGAERRFDSKPELVSDFWEELGALVHESEGRLASLADRAATVLWSERQSFDARRCVRLFEAASAALERRAGTLERHLGWVPTLRAGVARGEVLCWDLGGLAGREILREGEPFERAAALLRENHTASVLFDAELAGRLAKCGVAFERLEDRPGEVAGALRVRRGAEAPPSPGCA